MNDSTSKLSPQEILRRWKVDLWNNGVRAQMAWNDGNKSLAKEYETMAQHALEQVQYWQQQILKGGK